MQPLPPGPQPKKYRGILFALSSSYRINNITLKILLAQRENNLRGLTIFVGTHMPEPCTKPGLQIFPGEQSESTLQPKIGSFGSMVKKRFP